MDTQNTRFDHRELQKGKQKWPQQGDGFFEFFPHDVGAGLPFWLPKAAFVREKIEQFWREEHRKRDYRIVFTPHIGKTDLWETSGHLQYFKDQMYEGIRLLAEAQDEDVMYTLRPMNCPFHISIYKSMNLQHDQLPLRLAELGTVYRREPVDELSHGLLRVRGFTQDDSHIFCRKDQVENEVYRVLNFAFDMLRCFGFDKEDYEVRICTRRKGTRIDVNSWRWAQKILADAAKQILGVGSLEWADRQSLFYGAQLDVEIKDRWRTRWVCSTIQLDLLLAEKFGLLYEESDGDHRSQPYIIHRTLLGSLERFYALLMEHHDGALPVWLAPIQAMVIPVAAEQHLGYATEVKDMLCRAGLRATVDSRNKGLGWKLRNHTAESYDKVPYLLVVGSQEMKQNTVSLRLRTRENLGERSLSDFIQLALSVDRSRSRSLLPDYDNAM